MTTEQKVAQLMVWTYPEKELDQESVAWFTKYQPGGLVVFRRNIQSLQQITELNYKLQRFALKEMKAPFLLMIDQEGGLVTRLRTAQPLPSALAVGSLHDAKIAYDFGAALGNLLHLTGFNMNLAPVLDISPPTKKSFIGNRSYGGDPDSVVESAISFAQGLIGAKIIPTGKHFPGHGSVMADSHRGQVLNKKRLAELQSSDFIPFLKFAKLQGPKAVMMAHISVPEVEDRDQPATYSKKLIQQELRGRLSFDGLVITDDLEMAGAKVGKSVGERVVNAFLAGNDLLMLAGSREHQKEAFDAIVTAVNNGVISRDRLNASVERILTHKQIWPVQSLKPSAKTLNRAVFKVERLSQMILKTNTETALQDNVPLLPKITSAERILVISTEPKFLREFSEFPDGSHTDLLLQPKNLDPVMKQVLQTQSEYSWCIVYVTGIKSARWVARFPLEVQKKMIIVNAGYSGLIPFHQRYKSVITINSNDPRSAAALATALKERLPASESSPNSHSNEH